MRKILIIDDSEIIRNLLKDFFKDIGYEVDTAINGQEGIDIALKQDYDVIFCDTHMPKKNGYQVFKAIFPTKPNSKFIMTDSMPDNLAEQTCREGAYGILTKPFDLEEVKKTMESLFGKLKPV